MQLWISAKTPVVTIFWQDLGFSGHRYPAHHARRKPAHDPSNLPFLAEHGREVIYDAEHFSMAIALIPNTHSPPSKPQSSAVLRRLFSGHQRRQPALAGRRSGGRIFSELLGRERVRRRNAECGLQIRQRKLVVGIHLTMIAKPARQFTGSSAPGPGAGHGQWLWERCGNANLISIIPDLAPDGFIWFRPVGATNRFSRYVSERRNLSPDSYHPYGASALLTRAAIMSTLCQKCQQLPAHRPSVIGNQTHQLNWRARTTSRSSAKSGLDGLSRDEENRSCSGSKRWRMWLCL